MASNKTAKELDKIVRVGEDKLHSLGGGLYLKKDGDANLFIFRYQVDKQAKKMSLHAYHQVHNTLGNARLRVLELKARVKQGIDPKEEEQLELLEKEQRLKELAKAKEQQEATFEKMTYETIEARKGDWTNHKSIQSWENTLKRYAFPVIGHIPVSEVTKEHIVKILQPIWLTKHETAKRLRSRIELVFSHSIFYGHRITNNPAAYKDNLRVPLPLPKSVKKRKHKALPYKDLPNFMIELSHMNGMGARALELCILNANRTSEVLLATWDEFDLDKRTWTIPAERMKMDEEHAIPLSNESLGLLKNLAKHRMSKYVFPNLSSLKHLSQAGMSSVVKRMGYKGMITVHGFRSTFRDCIAEKTNFSGEIAEMALAHAVPNQQESYRRGDLMEKRTVMMQWYSDYAYGKPLADNVSQIRA